MGRRKEEHGTNPLLQKGVIASNGVNGSLKTCTESGVCTGGTGIQGEFKLNNFEDGILSSAFRVGLLLASPIFASLAKRYQELANRVDEALGFMAASGLTIGHPIMTTTEF